MGFSFLLAFPMFVAQPASTPAPAAPVAAATPTTSAGVVAPGGVSPRRVAVVCLGPNVETSGALQRALEDRLLQISGITLVRDDTGGTPALIEESTPSSDPGADLEVKSLFDEARQAYAEGEHARALDRLSAIATIRQRFGGGGRAVQVQLRLWRATAFLKLSAELDAEAEATEAINLQPDVELAPQSYSPELIALVTTLRAKLPPPASVVVEGLPQGASIRVDGRPVWRDFRVLQGKHRVKITAPGWQPWEHVIAIDGNKTLTPGLALSLDKDVSQRLTEAAWWGSLAADDDGALAKLFHRTGADFLLVVATKPGAPAIARSMLIPAERTWAVLHGGVVPIDAAAPVRIADLALTTARPDAAIDIAVNPSNPLGGGSDTVILKSK